MSFKVGSAGPLTAKLRELTDGFPRALTKGS
jgi:hypothetical protein